MVDLNQLNCEFYLFLLTRIVIPNQGIINCTGWAGNIGQ